MRLWRQSKKRNRESEYAVILNGTFEKICPCLDTIREETRADSCFDNVMGLIDCIKWEFGYGMLV